MFIPQRVEPLISCKSQIMTAFVTYNFYIKVSYNFCDFTHAFVYHLSLICKLKLVTSGKA